MKEYFVQTKHSDGAISLSLNTSAQVVEMMGFRDCTGCDYEVFVADEFGSIVHLTYKPATKAPYNLHVFVRDDTGEVEIEGFSLEH